MAGKGWQPGWCSYPVSLDFRPGLFVVGDTTVLGCANRARSHRLSGRANRVMPPPKVASQLNKSPRRKPGDSGWAADPACHAIPICIWRLPSILAASLCSEHFTEGVCGQAG